MFTDLNFTEEEKEEGFQLLDNKNIEGFESFLKEHPACDSWFGFKPFEFMFQIKKLVMSGNTMRAKKLFSILAEKDFNKTRRQTILVLFIGILVFFFFIGLFFITKNNSAKNIESNIENFKSNCITRAEAFDLEHRIIETKKIEGSVYECWYKQNGEWKLQSKQ